MKRVKSSCFVKAVVWEHLLHAQHACCLPKNWLRKRDLVEQEVNKNGALNLLVTWTTIEIGTEINYSIVD
jgi:hypothetical protein